MGNALELFGYLNNTATSFESVKRSPLQLGNMAARTKVNRPEVEDKTFTTPAAVSFKASW